MRSDKTPCPRGSAEDPRRARMALRLCACKDVCDDSAINGKQHVVVTSTFGQSYAAMIKQWETETITVDVIELSLEMTFRSEDNWTFECYAVYQMCKFAAQNITEGKMNWNRCNPPEIETAWLECACPQTNMSRLTPHSSHITPSITESPLKRARYQAQKDHCSTLKMRIEHITATLSKICAEADRLETLRKDCHSGGLLVITRLVEDSGYSQIPRMVAQLSESIAQLTEECFSVVNDL